MRAQRVAAVWCPDWPVVAAATEADVSLHLPVAVLAANRVVACSEVARAENVRRGLRRREAQALCPELVLLDADPDRDARAFEPVVVAIEALAPGVEVIRPGLAAFRARGPARYFGSEAAAAERVVDAVAADCGVEALVGVAEGAFAAALAARNSGYGGHGGIIPAGGTVDFLATLDLAVIDRPELVGLMRRLGIRTVGAFAALPAADVLARFGSDGAAAHRLARGLEPRPLVARLPPVDLSAEKEIDPPADRIDTVAFVARVLAEEFAEGLARYGLACTRLVVEAVTVNGEELSRTWRHDGVLTAAEISDRVRWQLDGWLTGRSHATRPTAGVCLVRLAPEDVVEHGGAQLGLWGDPGADDARAHRAFARVQGLLGPDAVQTSVIGGGRDPIDRVRYVPWRQPREPGLPTEPPWPGRLPTPWPFTVHTSPPTVSLLDVHGELVGVTGRHLLTTAPSRALLGDGAAGAVSGQDRRPAGGTRDGGHDRGRAVLSWAGPWPADERWWSPEQARRRAWLQVVLEGAEPSAFLLALEAGGWRLAGVYD